ncbi:hypothetical protein M8J76_016899 [Diaphorina citri]|nr:hypothetical protein M8J76_016899 [Diaphorina citri]
MGEVESVSGVLRIVTTERDDLRNKNEKLKIKLKQLTTEIETLKERSRKGKFLIDNLLEEYKEECQKCDDLQQYMRERDLLEENEKLNQQIRQMNDLNESLRSKNEKDDMVEELENDFHNFPNEIEELRAYENKLLQENLNLKEYLQVQNQQFEFSPTKQCKHRPSQQFEFSPTKQCKHRPSQQFEFSPTKQCKHRPSQQFEFSPTKQCKHRPSQQFEFSRTKLERKSCKLRCKMSPTRPQTCPPMSRFSYKGNMHGNTSQGTSQSILKSPCHHPEGNRASDNQEKIYVKIGTVSTADGRKIDSCVQKRQSAQDMMEPNNPRHVAFPQDCHHPEGNRASDNQEKIYVKIGTVSTADGRKIDSCVQKRQSAQDMMEPNNPRHVAFRSDLLNDGNHGPDQKVCSFHYPNPSNPKAEENLLPSGLHTINIAYGQGRKCITE